MKNRYWTVVVGSYASADDPGIQTFIFDRMSGSLQLSQKLSGIENPSYLTLDQENRLGYVVSEKEDGEVACFRLDKEDQLFLLNKQKTWGSSPCYVEKKNPYLYTVNYMGGNVTVFPLEQNGEIVKAVQTISYEGSGPNRERQEASHPHTIRKAPKSKAMLVANLGTDHIYIYEHEEETGKLKLVNSEQTPAGMGPRHLAFHPTLPFVYVSGELNSTVGVYKWEREQNALTLEQTISTLPEDERCENTVAEIQVSPNGETLYCSNRGHDSLAVYRVEANGRLSLMQHISTNGEGPRHFSLLPTNDYLIVANQFSNTIRVFQVLDDGHLQETPASVSMTQPVSVQVISRD